MSVDKGHIQVSSVELTIVGNPESLDKDQVMDIPVSTSKDLIVYDPESKKKYYWYLLVTGLILCLVVLWVVYQVTTFDHTTGGLSSVSLPVMVWGQRTLQGNTTIFITGKELILEGTLSLKENSSLVLRNSILTLKMDQGGNSVIINARGTARLSIIDSIVRQYESYCLVSNWEFHESSSIWAKNMRRDCNWITVADNASYKSSSSNTGLTISKTFTGDIDITDDNNLALLLFIASGFTTITTMPQHGTTVDSGSSFFQSLALSGSWTGASIEFHNSKLDEIAIGVSSGVHLTVNDTELVAITWKMGLNSDDAGSYNLTTITNMNDRFVDNEIWEFSDSSVRLVNTRLQSLSGIFSESTKVSLNNCTLGDISASLSTQLTIHRSVISSLILTDDAEGFVFDIRFDNNRRGMITLYDNAFLAVEKSPEIVYSSIVVNDNSGVVLLSL